MISLVFYESETDGPTDGPTERRTDRPGYRDARTQLKRDLYDGVYVFFCFDKFDENEMKQEFLNTKQQKTSITFGIIVEVVSSERRKRLG